MRRVHWTRSSPRCRVRARRATPRSRSPRCGRSCAAPRSERAARRARCRPTLRSSDQHTSAKRVAFAMCGPLHRPDGSAPALENRGVALATRVDAALALGADGLVRARCWRAVRRSRARRRGGPRSPRRWRARRAEPRRAVPAGRSRCQGWGMSRESDYTRGHRPKIGPPWGVDRPPGSPIVTTGLDHRGSLVDDPAPVTPIPDGESDFGHMPSARVRFRAHAPLATRRSGESAPRSSRATDPTQHREGDGQRQDPRDT